MDPLSRAVRRRRLDGCGLQVANGTAQHILPTPNGSAAREVEAAWAPIRTGQPVPMLGERTFRWELS